MSGSTEPRQIQPEASPYVTEIRFARAKPIGSTGSYTFLLLFLGLLYTNLPLLAPFLEALRPAQLVAACGIAMLIAESMLSRRGIHMVWPESYMMLAFLGASVLSAFTALWPRLAAESVIELAKMAAIYLLIVNSVESQTRLRGVIWTLILGGIAPAVGTINNYMKGVMIEGTRAAWIGIFANPNEVAYSLVVLVPLAVLLGTTSRGWLRPLAWAVLPVYLAAMYFSYSRGGLIGLAVVMALMGLRLRSRTLAVLCWTGLIVGALFISNHWSRGVDFSNVTRDLTFQQRLATIRVGLEVFKDDPLLGSGLGCSVAAWPLYAPSDLYTQEALMCHNTFVQALSETGIVGFIPFIALLSSSLYHARKLTRASAMSGDEMGARLGGALEVSLWGFVVCGLSGGFVLTWFPYLLIGLLSSAKMLTRTDEASVSAVHSTNIQQDAPDFQNFVSHGHPAQFLRETK
jgi:O-antigen ligase